MTKADTRVCSASRAEELAELFALAGEVRDSKLLLRQVPGTKLPQYEAADSGG